MQGPKGFAGRNGTDGDIGDEGKMGQKVQIQAGVFKLSIFVLTVSRVSKERWEIEVTLANREIQDQR